MLIKKKKNIPKEFAIGEGLVGQCALEKEKILLTNVPQGYVKISSGLGKAKPANLIILPMVFENNVKPSSNWHRLMHSAKHTLTSCTSLPKVLESC